MIKKWDKVSLEWVDEKDIGYARGGENGSDLGHDRALG